MKTTLKVITEVERQRKADIVKPAELIDIRPAKGTTLSLAARKYFNFMLKAAGDKLAEPVRHRITKKALRRGDKSNRFMTTVLDELANTFVRIMTVSSRNVEALARVPLIVLYEETDTADDAWVEYEFHPAIREIISDSEIYAALEAQAVHALKSKYALMLYELGCKMRNRDKPTVAMSIEEFRDMLSVPEGSLKDFAQIRNTILEKARREIDHVADFRFEYLAIRDGRAVTKIELQFWLKSADGIDAARTERGRHSAGRKARRAGKVEQVDVVPALPAPENPRSTGIPGVPVEDIERLMRSAKKPLEIMARAMEAEKTRPGRGREIIQAALTD